MRVLCGFSIGAIAGLTVGAATGDVVRVVTGATVTGLAFSYSTIFVVFLIVLLFVSF